MKDIRKTYTHTTPTNNLPETNTAWQGKGVTATFNGNLGHHARLAFCHKTTNIDVADFMEKLAYLGCSVPKSTASSWWVKLLDVPASFSLTASVIMAEIKTSRKEHDVKGVVQAKPFQLCHMRQVESVCVRATNPAHSALAAWGRLACPCGATRRRFPAVESWIVWFYGRCDSRNLPES